MSCPQRPPERSGAGSRSSRRDHFPSTIVPGWLQRCRRPAHAELQPGARRPVRLFRQAAPRTPQVLRAARAVPGPRGARRGLLGGGGGELRRRAGPRLRRLRRASPSGLGGGEAQAQAAGSGAGPGASAGRGRDAAAKARGRPAAGAPNKGYGKSRAPACGRGRRAAPGARAAGRAQGAAEARGARAAGGQQAGLRRLEAAGLWTGSLLPPARLSP